MTAFLRQKSGRMDIRLIIGIVLIVLAAGGWLLFSPGKKKDDGPSRVAEITQGSIEEVVTAQGKLEPMEYVDVGAQVSGQISKLYVELGQNVKKGDMIAEIDPRVYQSRVEADNARIKTLEAQVAQQQAQVELARQQHARNQKLIKAKAISQEDFDTTRTNLKVTEGQLASIRAQIEEQNSTLEGDRTNLSYTKIYAPMDGTVVSQSTREGQTVNANQTAPVIVQLAKLDTMTVRAQVAEADVTRITPDMEVSFTTLGAGERRWKGKVRQILPSPETINDVVLYNALVDVDNSDRSLMTGMSTQMFFQLGSAKDIPLVPVAALGKRVEESDKGEAKAYEVRVVGKERKKPETRIILVGLMNRDNAEVKEGLAIGEKVLLVRQDSPKPGGQQRMPRAMGPRL
jgi:macrolide-specific efflux system membrane fusion protein